jgi:hypothetical protein
LTKKASVIEPTWNELTGRERDVRFGQKRGTVSKYSVRMQVMIDRKQTLTKSQKANVE